MHVCIQIKIEAVHHYTCAWINKELNVVDAFGNKWSDFAHCAKVIRQAILKM